MVTDGYQVYHKLGKEREDLIVSGCWVHCRRRFAELIKTEGLKQAKGTVAHEAYEKITEIMHLNNVFDDLPSADRQKQRQLVLTDKVDAYFAWVKLKYTQVSHNGNLVKALAYSIHQEKYLRMFLTDGDIPMANNCGTGHPSLYNRTKELRSFRIRSRCQSQRGHLQSG